MLKGLFESLSLRDFILFFKFFDCHVKFLKITKNKFNKIM